MSGHLNKDWEQLNDKLKNTLHHHNSPVHMCTIMYMARLCKDQWERGNVGLKGCIFAHDNISCILNHKRALAEYSQIEMRRGAPPRYFRANAVMKLELDPRDPSMFKYNKLWMHVLDQCVTTDTLALLNTEGAHTAPGVSTSSVPAGVPHPQMTVVRNLPAIPSKGTLAPAQAIDGIHIAKGNNTIDTTMDNVMKAFKAWTFQKSKVNEPEYGGYHTATAYPIEAQRPPQQIPMHVPTPHVPTGPNYHHHPWQELGPCIYWDELEHIRTFCPHARTDHDQGIIHYNQYGILTSGPRGGNGGEISGYQPEKKSLSIREYAWDIACQRQQRWGVATTAAPQPPQLQHVAMSQVFQRANSSATLYA